MLQLLRLICSPLCECIINSGIFWCLNGKTLLFDTKQMYCIYTYYVNRMQHSILIFRLFYHETVHICQRPGISYIIIPLLI